MKHKPGEYVCVIWDSDDPPCEAVHGHVDLAMLNESLRTEGVETFEDGTPVRHTYWRMVPCRGRDYDNRFMFDVPPGPGAFPVTVVDL